MYNYEKFIEEIDYLTDSIVYKMTPAALAMNKNILDNYPTLPNPFNMEPENWKYYMNLAGEYHPADLINYPDGIQVTLIETDEVVKLTKEILAEYDYTRNNIINRGYVYKDIITNYPRASLLLKGMINPVPTEDSINAKEGDILSYIDNFVLPQEYSLIPRLNEAIKLFLERWVLDDYALTDDLYAATVLNTTQAMIKLKIHNIRLALVGTNEAHDFHVSEFFRSNLSLDKYVDVLPPKQKLWLYKHLRYLITNTGQDGVLSQLIDNVILPSGLSVKEHDVLINKPYQTEDPLVLADITKPTYLIDDGQIYSKDNNGYIEKIDTTELTIRALETLGVYGADFLEDEQALLTLLKMSIDKASLNEKTKILSIGRSLSLPTNPMNKANIVIENMFNIAFSTDIKKSLEFTDDNSGIVYGLTEREAGLIMIKLLLKVTETEPKKISSLWLNDVLSSVSADASLNTELPLDEVMEPIYMAHVNTVPKLNTVTNIEDINTYIVDVISWYRKFWVGTVNEFNPAVKFLNGVVLERVRKPLRVTLSNTPMYIDDILDANGVYFDTSLEAYDYNKTLRSMIKLFTGIDVYETKRIEDLLESFRIIVDRLTSYTLLTITDEVEEVKPLTNGTVGIIRGLDAAIIKDGTSKCLEYGYGKVTGTTDDDNDFLTDTKGVRISMTRGDTLPTGNIIATAGIDEIVEEKISMECEPC